MGRILTLPMSHRYVHTRSAVAGKRSDHDAEWRLARSFTFERIAAIADCDVLAFGHTHKPWIREHAGVLFVNCGSVGKPKDGDPRASFAALEPVSGDVRVTIERVPYDADAVAAEMRQVGLPDELADKLPLAA
jgi:diadenosine tetraphosphatase ApaH/serine/threonine PP2A family protein phosphatase